MTDEDHKNFFYLLLKPLTIENYTFNVPFFCH